VPKYRVPWGFRKSIELFNQHHARTVDASQPLVVVEGYFACMRVWQAGHRRVVSLMGSLMSEAQEVFIVQTAGPNSRVILLLDEDEAGRKGRADARERLARSVDVRIVRFDAEGMQPDSLAAAELLALIHEHAGKEMAA
jgi:DNA primase